MNEEQVWQTIALDLKRAANYLSANRVRQANYYLEEAKRLYGTLRLSKNMRSIRSFIRFEGNPEEILLGSSLIGARI